MAAGPDRSGSLSMNIGRQKAQVPIECTMREVETERYDFCDGNVVTDELNREEANCSWKNTQTIDRKMKTKDERRYRGEWRDWELDGSICSWKINRIKTLDRKMKAKDNIE